MVALDWLPSTSLRCRLATSKFCSTAGAVSCASSRGSFATSQAPVTWWSVLNNSQMLRLSGMWVLFFTWSVKDFLPE